jgi:hypothetical protein
VKHLLSTICLLTLFAGAPKIITAQDAGSPHEQSARSWPSPEESVAKLDSKLSLTDDQKAKIYADHRRPAGQDEGAGQ